jgi:tetratricopeptide (TPR) repeat protein
MIRRKTMKIKPQLIRLLERALAEEQALLTHLPEEQRAALGELNCWAPKDVVGHLADWKERLAANMAAVARGESPVTYDNYLEVNDQGFLEHREKPWTAMLEWAEAAHEHLVEQVAGRSEDELYSTGGWPGNQPLWQRIVGTGYVHTIQMHLCPFYQERGQGPYAEALQEEASRLLGGMDESASWQGTVRYNLACHYALSGKKEMAIAKLGEALALNPGLREWSLQDTDLDCLRQEPGYLTLCGESSA